jgi:hypothetical protein
MATVYTVAGAGLGMTGLGEGGQLPNYKITQLPNSPQLALLWLIAEC